MRLIPFLLSTFVMLALGAACDSPRDVPAETPPKSDTSRTTASDTTPGNLGPGRSETPAVESDVWSADAREEDLAVSGVATIADIRIAAHEGYDRIVIEMDDRDLPAYSVKYLDEPPMECGSGEPVELAGGDVLEIRLAPARGYTDEGKSTIRHDLRSPNLTSVKEAAISCDFEANFTVAAGIDGRRPFRVQTLREPLRLIVDVRQTP